MRLIDADRLLGALDTTFEGSDYTIVANIVKNIPTAMQWVSAEDGRPQLGSPVLAHFSSGQMKVVQLANISEQFVDEGHAVCPKCSAECRKVYEHCVTHWMPLPEPPEK